MKLIAILVLTVVAILALTGAAEAAIASSGGGLSSAITGAGFSSAASSISAGHSASVAKTLTQTLVAAGSFSTSTSGTESATDGTVTVNVQAANLHITGFLDGVGTVLATASVAANGDENPGPITSIWVDTLIEALTNVNVNPGVHGTATARATGTATARGTNAGVGTVTALSQGTATASSDARDLFANGAVANAMSQIWSDAALYTFGTGIGINEHMPPIFTTAVTAGGGTASATASGSSVGTATSATGSGSVSASGRVTADARSTGDRLSAGITQGAGTIDGYFQNYGMNNRYAKLETMSMVTGMANPGFPDYHGTASGSATGTATVNGRDTLAGATFRDTASGRVASTATQDGVGIAVFQSQISAQDGGVGTGTIALDIPRDTFAWWSPNPSPAFGTSYLFVTTAAGNLDESEIHSDVTINEEGGRGTGSSSASGSASTSTTIGALGPGILGDRTTTSANGQTSISGTVDGGLTGAPDSLTGFGIINSQAMTEGTTDYFDLTAGGPALGTFDTDAGAVSVVNGHIATSDWPVEATSFTGAVSANGQTTASAVNDGVIAADAASRAGGSVQGRFSGPGVMDNGLAFGAEAYGYAFTGSWSTGGPLFGTPTNEFAITNSGIEARGVLYNSWIGSQQSYSGRLTGGTAHGDAGNAVAGIRSIDVRSDTTGSTDVSGSFATTVGVSQTRAATYQVAAYFPGSDSVDVVTISTADTLTRDTSSIIPPPTVHGSTSAALTGFRTSGAGSYDNLVPANPFTVSSDALLSGGMRVTETTASAVDGFSQTMASSEGRGSHFVTADTDLAQVWAWYAAQSQGFDAMNQRGMASITGLSLAGHAASEADTARLTLTGGMAQVNLNTLPNSAPITFPIRAAILGGTPAATLGMSQGVLTGSSVTAPINFAYGEWAGVVDSQNPAVVPPYPI